MGWSTIKIDDTTALPFFSGATLGPVNRITFDDGFYYSFRILDPVVPPPINLNLAVMKTSARPISVSRTAQIPAVPKPGDQVTVKIATSQAKSSEERIYVRWSTDTFITSTLIEATSSGVSYSATIPPPTAGALLQYSIITSTADLTPFTTPGRSTRGFSRQAEHSMPSFQFCPPSRLSLRSIGPGWSKSEVRCCRGGYKTIGLSVDEERDEYFGSDQRFLCYSPEHVADNGAIFTVTISNRAGRVMSRNATLTVK